MRLDHLLSKEQWLRPFILGRLRLAERGSAFVYCSVPRDCPWPFFENRIEKKSKKNKVLLPERAVETIVHRD